MSGRLIHILYRLAWYLLLPAVLVRLIVRSRTQPAYRQHWVERFGFAQPKGHGPLIWVHAVSLGETRAAQPLIEALLSAYPQHRLLLTHMTPTGREEGARLFGDRVQQAYIPYDLPGFVDRFLNRWQPALGLLMETEVWPTLVARCAARKLPLLLVNARLSERSLRRALRFKALSQAIFPQLAGVACQSTADAHRLSQLGVSTVQVTGNLKFDVSLSADQLRAGHAQRQRLPHARVLIVANTRDGEETLLLEALKSQPLPPDSLIILVPRHPQRFDEVRQLIESSGRRACRRSQGQVPDAQTEIWLGDTLGEMPFYYAMADVAIMGGSFAPLGGHNLIEACASGVPVVCGPHMFNFAQASADAEAAGACVRVSDMAAAVHQVLAFWNQPQGLADMQQATQHFVYQHRGATQRTLQVVRTHLPSSYSS